ncbi:MAG: glycosyltransferase family 2 protein [Candidatus Promineifilaceae bacterium]|nr:glycosyltransferase family 2 protein [Candidatus Promineifilaceae bacterium]
MLSIVIVNWNTRDHLANCLSAIEHNHGMVREALQVIVVDNNSSDGSVALVEERFSWTMLIANQRNLGFAAANNQGIERSRGEFVLLLNADTRLHVGALERLLSFMATHPEAAAVGPRLLNTDGSLQVSCQPMLTPFREFWRLLFLDRVVPFASYRMNEWSSDEARQVDVLLGACLLLRRSVLDEVGLLDESYFMYTEEVDLFYRLSKSGYRSWYLPTATVTHHGGASSRQIPEKMYLELYRSKVRFYRKTGGERRARLFKTLVALAYVPRVLLNPTHSRYRRLLAHIPSL